MYEKVNKRTRTPNWQDLPVQMEPDKPRVPHQARCCWYCDAMPSVLGWEDWVDWGD